MTPVDFDGWAALVELGADLVLGEQHANRWICALGERNYASPRTNGGLGIIWADHDGREAVWLAWKRARSSSEYPRGLHPLWHARAKARVCLRAPRGAGESWRAWTWARGPSGLLEPGLVVDAPDPEAAVLEVLGRQEGRPAA